MTLPTIFIPEIPIPFEIPAFLSDYLVHFIVALPVVILLLELYNLVTKRPSISLFSLLSLTLLSLTIIAYYLIGSVTEDEHKLLIIYLVYASLALIIFKLLFMALRKTFGRILFILLLGGFASVTIMEVNSGGLFATKAPKVIKEEVIVKETVIDKKAEDELRAKLQELQEKYNTLVQEKEKVVVVEVEAKAEPKQEVAIETVKEEKKIEVEEENSTVSTSEDNSSN